jgi:ABC-type lipoprotein export system ATPase subunit
MNSITLHSLLPHVFENETIVSDIWNRDIEFEAGNNYLIESASGKGKSSLCSYVFGYRHDYSGNITFDGKDISALAPKQWDRIRQSQISLLFQELRLFPELTAMENVLIKNRLSDYKSLSEIDALFAELKIEEKKDCPAARLSWGQQQRVAIIRCLCQPFRFLFLDEPISHLDDENGEIVAAIVAREAQRQQAAVIVTSIGKHPAMPYQKIFAL